MSLTRQLLLVVLLSLAVAIVGATTVVVITTRGDLQRRLDAQTAQIAQLAARGLVGVQGNAAGAERIAAAVVAGGHVQRIVLADGSGQVLAQATAPAAESAVPEWFVAIAALRPAAPSAEASPAFTAAPFSVSLTSTEAVEPPPTPLTGGKLSSTASIGAAPTVTMTVAVSQFVGFSTSQIV